LKIIITGSSGQLGCDLIRVLSSSHELTSLTRGDLDITDNEKVMGMVSYFQPDVIIHAAAFTGVDGAEKERKKAYEVNALGTRNIAEAAQQTGAKLVYISTDYVFDGNKGESYNELDPPSPLSVYGESKLIGEQFVKKLCDQFFIVRTAWLFGSNGDNFVKKIYSLARAQNQVLAAIDCVGSPTYSLDLATFIGNLIYTDKYGMYHATNQGFCSRFEFAQAILEEAGLSSSCIVPVESSTFRLPAARPHNSALDDRAIRESGLPLFRNWRSALHTFIATDHYFKEDKR
jgi:dTDP-4-dehydrorhamnose reductase